jgi:hypothetical protein
MPEPVRALDAQREPDRLGQLTGDGAGLWQDAERNAAEDL